MLDGRIDTQGTVADLQAQGVLEGIEHSAVIDAHKGSFQILKARFWKKHWITAPQYRKIRTRSPGSSSMMSTERPGV
jgi:hypothetical protein